MTGIKVGDIVKHREGYHGKVVAAAERGGRRGWSIKPIEGWAKSHTFATSREVIAIYRPLKGSR